MNEGLIVQVSGYPGWIVGVSRGKAKNFYCWVINANFEVLNDGQSYETSHAAMLAGRSFVEGHL
jgi:hypothetical protein